MLTQCRVARRCNKDTVVNGIPIKEGCLVAIPQYYLHFRDDCWTDPERFNPERFGIVQTYNTHACGWHPVYTSTHGHMQYSLDHSMWWDYWLYLYDTYTNRLTHIHTFTQTARYHTDPLFCCRFSKSEKSSIHPGAFIPFGSGPRICIGMRLAIMEVKMTLIEVLSKFRIVMAPETKVIICTCIDWFVALPRTLKQSFKRFGNLRLPSSVNNWHLQGHMYEYNRAVRRWCGLAWGIRVQHKGNTQV